MRIGLVCPYNIFKNGGVQECVLALRSEYARLGHEAHIITPRPRGVEVESVDGILLVGESRDFNLPTHTTAQLSVSFDNQSIDDLLAHHDFDVLHFHEPWVPIVSRQILTRSSTINIATFHAKLPDMVMAKTLAKVVTPYTKSILKYFNAFTAVSEAAADYVHTISDETINLIPNAIDLDKFKVSDTSKKRVPGQILYVGRLEKRKGVKYLLQAFKLLQEHNPDVSLVLTGDGPERERLEDYVTTNKLKNVEFLGFVDETKKIDLLHSASLFCSPALYGESFGIVLLEAMAAGCVTVAGSNPGYDSVMTDKGAISLVNVTDTQEFARRLELLLNDDDVRKLWLDWASQYIKRFTYKKVAKQYLDIYENAKKVQTRS